MWIAREKNGLLRIYTEKPIRREDLGVWFLTDTSHCLTIDYTLFPKLKWEDEPKEVYLNTGYDMADQINHVWAMLKCTQEELDKAHQTTQYYRTKFDAMEKIFNDI